MVDAAQVVALVLAVLGGVGRGLDGVGAGHDGRHAWISCNNVTMQLSCVLLLPLSLSDASSPANLQ